MHILYKLTYKLVVCLENLLNQATKHGHSPQDQLHYCTLTSVVPLGPHEVVAVESCAGRKKWGLNQQQQSRTIPNMLNQQQKITAKQ